MVLNNKRFTLVIKFKKNNKVIVLGSQGFIGSN